MIRRVLTLEPRTYERHAIHGEGRTWAETNCYMDVWIELLHALGHEPIAALPCTVAIDFEGDQWTFFKIPLPDLTELYGLDVQELAIWRPLAAHIEEQVARRHPVLVELDSFFLPDTAGSAYREAHVKTTVAIVEIDCARGHLGYFHNQGYHHLGGADYLDALRLREPSDPGLLAPYVEFVKIRREACRDRASLLQCSLGLLRAHLGLLPAENPFPKFKARFERDQRWLLEGDLDKFHQYSFATLRQFGACFELARTYLEWLTSQGERGLEAATQAYGAISEGAKLLQFQLARAVNRRRPLDLDALDEMADAWQRAATALRTAYL